MAINSNIVSVGLERKITVKMDRIVVVHGCVVVVATFSGCVRGWGQERGLSGGAGTVATETIAMVVGLKKVKGEWRLEWWWGRLGRVYGSGENKGPPPNMKRHLFISFLRVYTNFSHIITT